MVAWLVAPRFGTGGGAGFREGGSGGRAPCTCGGADGCWPCCAAGGAPEKLMTAGAFWKAMN
jgi:hypothetical protein